MRLLNPIILYINICVHQLLICLLTFNFSIVQRKLYRQMREYIYKIMYDKYENKLTESKENVGHHSRYRQKYMRANENSNLIEVVGKLGELSDTTKLFIEQMTHRKPDPLRCLVVLESTDIPKRNIRDCRHLIPAFKNLFKSSGNGHLQSEDVVLIMGNDGGDYYGHISTHWSSDMAGWNAHVDKSLGLSYGFRYRDSMVTGANEYFGDREHPLCRLKRYTPEKIITENNFKYGYKMILPGMGTMMSNSSIIGRYDKHNGALSGWQCDEPECDIGMARIAMNKSKINLKEVLILIEDKRLAEDYEVTIRNFTKENIAYVQREHENRLLEGKEINKDEIDKVNIIKYVKFKQYTIINLIK